MTSLIILFALGGLMQAAHSFGATGSLVAGPELAFGFLLLAAFYGGRIVESLRSPKVTGYLVIGVIAGPSVLELISLDMVSALKIINGVAVCLIALTAGGELSIRKMKPLLKTIRAMTIFAVMGTTVLLTLTIFLIRPLVPFFADLNTTQGLVVSLVLAVTLASQSPAVVMALLSETKSDGPLSQTTLALVIIADLVVIVLYALASSMATAVIGGGVDVAATIKTVAWELFGSAGIGVVIGIILAAFIRYVGQGQSLFAVLICFVVAEVGVRIHLDPLIVTLAAGVYLENISKVDATKLIHQLEGASLPVYLVFFALAGAALKLDLLYGVLIPAAIIAVIRGFGFWWGCRFAARRTNADSMVEKWTWVGLLPQAGLALALALIMARTFPSFGIEAQALVLGVVGLNQLITPVILRIALIKSGEAGKRADISLAH